MIWYFPTCLTTTASVLTPSFHIPGVPISIEAPQHASMCWRVLFRLTAAASLPVPFCCSVAKSCWTLWKPVDCSKPGFLVLDHLPEFAETHVY